MDDHFNESQLWSSGSGNFSGDFSPNSLNDAFDNGSLGSLGSIVAVDDGAVDMDIREEDIKVELAPQWLNGRVSVFPDHPGPVVPMAPSQPFNDPLTPNMSVSPTTMSLLNKIFHFQSAQRLNLDKLRLAQLQILSRPSPQGINAIGNQEMRMRKDTQDALQALVHIWCNCLLSPMEIWRWDFLWSDLRIQLEQIRLFIEELQAFGSNTSADVPLCSLVIISQPFPTVCTRGRTIEGKPVVVQLLTGATVDLLQVSQVKAEAVIPKGTKGKLAADLMEKHVSSVHPDSKHAEFRIKFANGTRKQPVYFQFLAQVTVGTSVGPKTHHLCSAETPPTISVTNEVQWEEAEGILIEKSAFQDAETCPWFSLANHLQRHIVEGTRQTIDDLVRIFGQVELSYFHRTFFGGASMVSVDSFIEFWKWYGKAVHKIRYTKHILSLFLNGHLFGFIPKSDMEKALDSQPPGTFMVRFSERNAGSFSIAYVMQDADNPMRTMVRHYLVSHEDITQRKSLADFIGESPALTHFLRYDPASGFNLAPSPTEPQLRYQRQEKHMALAEYYAKRETIQQTSGYDSQLNPQPPQPIQVQPLPLGFGSASQSNLLSAGMGLALGETSPNMFHIDSSLGNIGDDYWNAE